MAKIVMGFRERFRLLMLRMSRRNKRLLMLASDSLTSLVSGFAAVWLSFGFWPAAISPLPYLSLTVLLGIVAASLAGFYRSIIRFIGVGHMVAAAKGSVIAAAGVSIYLSFLAAPVDVLRITIVFFCLQALTMLVSRYSARLFLNKRGKHREPVLIYGAGEGGVRLAAALDSSPVFLPVAFVDDDPAICKARIGGLEVHPPRSIGKLIADTGAERVLLAIPSASRRHRRRIIEKLEPFPLRVQTIPDVADIVTGKARVDDIREVPVEDLLGRDAVPPDEDLLRQENEGNTVLVTGAGGSIGSELCRQVMQLEPKRLLLLERSEIALYTVEKLLRSRMAQDGLDIQIVALLGCVTDKSRMLEIMKAYKVETVYHAAAYKHVPIVEHNVFEGVINNVIGTLSAARAALEARVHTFVLISTDKAVSPTNVMGASKRLSELVLQDLALQSSSTKFCMVRFGNVLASSGSVVPLFREQIRNGGPVTVTHPEIIRYFMTIPEAAQLVIQAGAMAKGGVVFVLDMGEPVKIIDLARRMIHLLGLTVLDASNPDGDIEIVFSGLRPAEKLYEELLIGTNVTGTRHPRILRANEKYLSHEKLLDVIADITTTAAARDWQKLIDILLESVDGYSPTGGLEDHIFVQSQNPAQDTVIRLVGKPHKSA